MVAAGNAPVLCDFGQAFARFGNATYNELVLPDLYRPSELLLSIRWDEKIDIWALGLWQETRASIFVHVLTSLQLVEGTSFVTDNRADVGIVRFPKWLA